jgi:subtilisin family serine protease
MTLPPYVILIIICTGLLGKNQIVGVSDTGLEEQSCYFSDSSGLVPRSKISSPIQDFSKRKVVQYVSYGGADTADAMNGHGTHVSGTVAGRIQNSDITTGTHT